MVDFQGVCLQRALRYEKSSGGLFRGVNDPSPLSSPSPLMSFRSFKRSL